MKKTLVAALVLSSVSMAQAADVALDSEEQKLGYSIGTMFGSRMANDFEGLDLEAFKAGFEDSFAGEEPQMSMEDIQATVQAFQMKQMQEAQAEQAKVAEAAKAQSEAWLEEKADEDGVKVTDSGLMYKVIEEGDGDKPAAEDTVTVNYEGKLVDGTVFDSSYERGEATTFPLNQVIPGWTEGVQLMSEGATYEFYIPSELAYGPGGTGPIGPNAALQFKVELIDIESAE
ncbi:FKBP-type peptidyl-prolyl cis-trans isomerase [Marinomonas ostreistagni]|uniref:FKBP-type peptidyl-prolyl cis-trans isomerase n=1 Tax=Marinomonas ostreistagni TaxID=359209 RepID=UPI00194FA5B2|nr:FKBP-type peptidyl-prolyl cis-trans isomerase [Marinomonas ostreistagni]MBM6551071.1 FKBP-type peptidyl-prolyl cis-trans isomerase [Marinomonas ostreistagni]